MAYCPLDNLNIQNREKLPVLEFYKRFKNDLKNAALIGAARVRTGKPTYGL